MASYVGAFPGSPFLLNRCSIIKLDSSIGLAGKCRTVARQNWRTRASSNAGGGGGGDSYLDLWKKAVTRENKTAEFERIAENSAGIDGEIDKPEELEKKSSEFQKILEVSTDERDKAQRMQVIDRAAAAIAAAKAILKDSLSPPEEDVDGEFEPQISIPPGEKQDISSHKSFGVENKSEVSSQTGGVGTGAPGPDFWSWSPPSRTDPSLEDGSDGLSLNLAKKASSPPTPLNPVMEKERTLDILSIPLETKVQTTHYPPLPPLQSIVDVKLNLNQEMVSEEEKQELGTSFSTQAAEAVHALKKGDDDAPSEGVNPDGSMWWKETGIEQKLDGSVCRWTITRGVSADKTLEWEEKYWEAADEFERKELGSEKSGRDAYGNVWREFWKESMWQENGLTHMEKTADKWGKNGYGGEWHEKWSEKYDSSGIADKWAHKWCSIDPNTQLEAGHAHVWHERWGETYDGYGGSTKYTDKWAERCEGDGWAKWGDKWDEHFDPNGHGVKQGEAWWAGKYGERWNRTWGEGHNGSGWVHKYGKSSSGEHWDTHVQEDTWYERFPHFGFQHCSDNSVQLRQVRKPSEWS